MTYDNPERPPETTRHARPDPHREPPPRSNGAGVLAAAFVAAIVSSFVAALVAAGVVLWFRIDAGTSSIGNTVPTTSIAQELASSPPNKSNESDEIEFLDGVVDTDAKRTFTGDQRTHLYRFSLPANAVHVSVDLDGGDVDMDLDIALGEDAARDEEWLDSAHSAESSETLQLGRARQPDFARKPLIVRVDRYDDGDGKAPYSLRVSVTHHATERRLMPGETIEATLGPDTAHRRAYEVVLPADVDHMRFDLTDVRQDLDLGVHVGDLLDMDEAAAVAMTPVAREALVIGRRDLRLARGEHVLQLVVIDRAEMPRSIPFTLHVTAGKDVPDAVRDLPAPPLGRTSAERAAFAVVSLLATDDEGSGVVIDPAGILLTAAHVVESLAIGADDVIIGVTDDPTYEPLELLRGRVTHRDDDLDLAIVQVTQTFAGDPLPDGWRLPSINVRWDLRPTMGERVHAIGYPMLHGGGDRSEITWATGTVSGYERHQGHLTMRFDAAISYGSSGGAVLDDQLRLVGIVTSAHGDISGFTSTGVSVPPESFPKEWIKLLR